MKRLLLLFIPLIFFFGCETDDDSNNDDSSICGNVSVTINGESRDYNPNTSYCATNTTVYSINGGYGVSVNFTSYCDNNNTDYTVGVGLNNFSNNNVWSFGPSLGLVALTNCNSVFGSPDFDYSNGTGTIDNIDYETRTIDGSFYLPPGDNGRPEVQCSFSNVPFL